MYAERYIIVSPLAPLSKMLTEGGFSPSSSSPPWLPVSRVFSGLRTKRMLWGCMYVFIGGSVRDGAKEELSDNDFCRTAIEAHKINLTTDGVGDGLAVKGIETVSR